MNIKNQLTLIGRLTRDFYVLETKTGHVLFNTVAVTSHSPNGKTTDFVEFKMFAQSDKALAYFNGFGKGDLVGLNGRLSTYKKDDKTVLQVLAESLDPTLESADVRKGRKSNAQTEAESSYVELTEEDMPF